MNYTKTVGEFHAKMNIHKNGPGGRPSKRLRLITEETAELIIAIDEHNVVEIADAAADLVYVIAGTIEVLGFEENLLFTRVFPDRAPGLQDRLNTPGQEVTVMALLNEHLGAVSTYMMAYANMDQSLLLKNELNKFIFSVREVAGLFGIPFDEVFKEVHSSNMSKQPLDEHGKGGKGLGYAPPQIKRVLENYA